MGKRIKETPDVGERDRRERNQNAYELYREISLKLSKVMDLQGLNQMDIQNRCREKGYPISQSTLSKILSYPNISSLDNGEDYTGEKSPYSITLASFFYICEALGISSSEILDRDSTMDIEDSQTQTDHGTTRRAQLIVKPTEHEFKGYQGSYHCYFFSTISSETQLLHGVLSLEPSTLKDYCKAGFKLGTNKYDLNKKEIFKDYTGKFAISPRMGSCYCLLESQEIGELCFIVFRHIYLNNENLKCRLAAVATASAGDNPRPTTHRMLICREEVPEEKLEILKSQLLLNTSDIFISKKNLEKLRMQKDLFFPKEAAELFDTTIHTEEYYRFSEFQIKNLDLGLIDKLRTICMLRNASSAAKYNKVGSKADELVFDYLTKEFNPPPAVVDDD